MDWIARLRHIERNEDGSATLQADLPFRYSPGTITGHDDARDVTSTGILDTGLGTLLLDANDHDTDYAYDHLLHVGAALLNGFKPSPAGTAHDRRFLVAMLPLDTGGHQVRVVDTAPPSEGGCPRGHTPLFFGVAAEPANVRDPVVRAAHAIAQGLDAIGFDWPDIADVGGEDHVEDVRLPIPEWTGGDATCAAVQRRDHGFRL